MSDFDPIENLIRVANVTPHYDDHDHELRVFAEGRKRHPRSMACGLCNALSHLYPDPEEQHERRVERMR